MTATAKHMPKFKLSRGINGGVVCELVKDHTPTPWKLLEKGGETQAIVRGRGKQGWFSISNPTGETSEKCMANTAFIVEACNVYDKLKADNAALAEAGKRCIMALEANGAPNCQAVKEMKEAIAAVGSDKP